MGSGWAASVYLGDKSILRMRTRVSEGHLTSCHRGGRLELCAGPAPLLSLGCHSEKSSSPATREILFAGCWLWLVAAAAGPSHASSRPVSGPGWTGWRAGPGPPCRAKQQAAARPTEFAALGLGLGPSGAQSVAQNLGTGADMDIGGVEAQCCTADM